MTGHHLRWRALGLSLLVVAGVISELHDTSQADGATRAWGLLIFAIAVAGAVLLINGRRVPALWRIERGRHRDLPGAIRARRRRSSPGRQ